MLINETQKLAALQAMGGKIRNTRSETLDDGTSRTTHEVEVFKANPDGSSGSVVTTAIFDKAPPRD